MQKLQLLPAADNVEKIQKPVLYFSKKKKFFRGFTWMRYCMYLWKLTGTLIQCVRALDILCVFVSSSKIFLEWLLKFSIGKNACFVVVTENSCTDCIKSKTSHFILSRCDKFKLLPKKRGSLLDDAIFCNNTPCGFFDLF